MLRRKPLSCAIALALAVAIMPLRAADPDILNQIPADSQLVVLIPNLAQLSDDITKIAAALDLPQPELQQPLEQIKGMLGIQKGLNESGGAALAMQSLPLGGGDPQVVAILPVSDYNAFAGNFGITDAGDGVSSVSVQGQPAFIKKSGGYAVFSNNQASVVNYKSPDKASLGAKAGNIGAELLSRGDIVAMLDVSQIGPMIQPLVAMQMQQFKAEIAQAVPPAQAGSIGAAFDMYNAAIQAVLRDGQALLIGVDVSPEGFGLNLALQFKDASPLASMFAASPKGELAFDRLPDKPYFLAASADLGAMPYEKWVNDFAAALPAEFPFAKLMTSGLELMKLSGGQSQMALYSPAMSGGGGFINSVTVYGTPQPEKFVTEHRKLIESLNNLDLGQGMTMRTSYTEGALQVEGVKRVDISKQKTEIPPELMAQAGMFSGLLGEQTSYVAAVKDAVVVATGVDPTSLKDTFAAAGGGGKLAEKGIKAIRPKLLGSRTVEAYVGIGSIVQFINGFLGLMAPQFVVDVPADLPPIATGLSSGKGGVGGTLYVPMSIVVAGKKYADKVMGMGSGSSGF